MVRRRRRTRRGAGVHTPGVSQRRAGATTFELPDRLGTSNRQTNATANVQATRTHDAFGAPTASAGKPKGPFGFAGSHGYQEDADSGLKLLGRRYYDASTGRFLTRDPAKDGRNWYGYVNNNPTGSVDPEGLEDKKGTKPGKFRNRLKRSVRVVFDYDADGDGESNQCYVDVPPGYETVGIDADWVRTREPKAPGDGFCEHIKGNDTMTGVKGERGERFIQPWPMIVIPGGGWKGTGAWPPSYPPPTRWPIILKPVVRPIRKTK